MGRIAGQLTKVKRRLNLLALQQMVFSSLGILIAAGATLVIAAFLLTPSRFLVAAILLTMAVLAGLPLVLSRALKRFSGFTNTAAIADAKAELHGRLTTLVTITDGDNKHVLWPFLVEDTVGRLDDFRPNRIEKHRISRSIYGLMGACLIAAIAGLMVYSARRHQEALSNVLKNLTLEVDPSQVTPADPDDADAGVPLEADPETLRSLAERLESGNQAARNRPGHINELAHKAQSLASRLQDRLIGRNRHNRGKVKIKLAENLENDKPDETGGTRSGTSNSLKQQSDNPETGDGAPAPQQSANAASGSHSQGEADTGSPAESDQARAPGVSPKAFERGSEGPGAGNESVPSDSKRGSAEEAGGRSAGGGSDPEHLMGPPDAPMHKSENFEIMIDARLSDRSSVPNAQPYVPPKVRASLSSYQHPDEPLDRGTVPAADRETVKRVFER